VIQAWVRVGRHELTDAARTRIERLLPPTGRRGGPLRDHRQVVNAILWQARTGMPWRDLPERDGPWKTAHERLRTWTADGTARPRASTARRWDAPAAG
jgi:transposase